jgi:hypothetical protein
LSAAKPCGIAEMGSKIDVLAHDCRRCVALAVT